MDTRKCLICNKEFEPKYSRDYYCSDKHFTKCCICGKNIELNKTMYRLFINGKTFTCGKLCATEKMKQTNLDKYGATCSLHNKDIEDKIRQNNIIKYGGISPFSNKDIQKQNLIIRNNKSEQEKQQIKDKVKQTNLERYGNSNYNNPEKFKNTMKQKYGVNYTNESELLRNKQQNTMKQKYGVKSSFCNGIIRDKINNNKYGNYNNIDKVKQTNLDRYGVPYYVMTDKCRTLNKEFANKLNEIGLNTTFEYRLGNYQYDIKCDDVVIEINPTYTHNSTIGPKFNNSDDIPPKDRYYHQNKTLLAKENNLRCIHIFDWEDWNKIIDIIKPKSNIYARNCELAIIDKNECYSFEAKYHLQGYCNKQTVKLGLYYNNMLVQVMTFGEPRYNKNYEWELLRLCTHNDYKIVGGSHKLFKYFLTNYKPKSIISYCDNSKFNGDVYSKLGFKLNTYGKPSLHWSKGNKHITNNLLNQRGYDQLFNTNYGKNTSNKELMLNNGWLEIYDCGQSVYVYDKNE